MAGSIYSKYKIKAYELLESIETNGTQYINTFVIPDNNTQWVLDCSLNTTSSSSGAYGGTSQRFHIERYSGKFLFGLKDKYITPANGDADRHTFKLNSAGTCSIDSSNYTISPTVTSAVPSLSILLGARHNNSGGINTYNITLYSTQIKTNTKEVDLVPVKRLEDNAIGLYDKVEGKFYGNAGTGEFIAHSLSTPKYIEEEVEGVEYIESNGRQYIDTGFTPNQDTKIDVIFQSATNVYGNCFYGVRKGVGDTAYISWQSSSEFADNYGSQDTRHLAPNDINKHHLVKDKNKVFYDEELVLTNTYETFTCEGTLVLFAYRNTSASASTQIQANGNYRIYYFKIWDNGVLVRDFVPVKIIATNEYCLFDRLSKALFHNAGTGAFTGGNKTKVEHIYPKIKINGYELLESIEATGSQWIDTGFKPNQDTSIEMSYKTTTTSGGSTLYYGAALNWGAGYGLYKAQNGVDIYMQYKGYTNIKNSLPSSQFNGTHIIKQDKNKLYSDGELKYTYSAQTFQSVNNLLLGDINDHTGSSYTFKGHYYYVKIWDNGKIIRHFIPVKRLSDNAVGMYDLVANQFYGSTGTGTFIAHSYSVPKSIELEQVDYIENSGTEYIDTGLSIVNPLVDMDFACTENTVYASSSFMLAKAFGTSKNFSIALYSNSVMRIPYQAGGYFTNVDVGTLGTTKHNVVYRNGLLQVDGVTKSTATVSSQDARKLNLFARGGNESAIIKLYACKIYDWNDGEPIIMRNFVPVKCGTEYCLYDKVEKKLYYNAGTGSFTGGTRTKVSKITELAGIDNNGIRYGKLNYLACTGTQKIDTGVLNKFNTRCEIDCELRSNVVGESLMSTGGYRYDIFRNALGKLAFRASDTSTKASLEYDSQRRTYIHSSNGSRTYYGDTTNEKYVIDTYTNQNYTIYLFGGTAEISFVQDLRCYGVRILHEGTLIRDFVPAQRLTDNVKGLFDRVNKVFYTNAGTGSFGGELNIITFN